MPSQPHSYPPRGVEHPFVELAFHRLPEREMIQRGRAFYAAMDQRRSVREFRADPVPRELIDLAVKTASTAPSGAHQQPWTFVVIGDAGTKAKIRVAVEAEERRSYEGGRMSEEWLRALEPLATTADKPYLEVVPWIVVAFEQIHGFNDDGSVRKHYYAKQSMGIACGMFISALHMMGLATLTHTPSPMRFLTNLLGRPSNEQPFVLFPIGYPADGCLVPELRRKTLDEVSAGPPAAS